MIIVWGFVDIDAVHLADAQELSLEHVRRSRGEPGCISHCVSVDREIENRLNFFEEWADMESLQQHFEVPESAAFAQRLGEMAVAPPQIQIYAGERVR